MGKSVVKEMVVFLTAVSLASFLLLKPIPGQMQCRCQGLIWLTIPVCSLSPGEPRQEIKHILT